MQKKLKFLQEQLATYDRLAVAFSGGVDSAFLLLSAFQVLDIKALAVTVVGSYFSPDETDRAKEFCTKHGILHLMLHMDEELTDSFSHNPPNRCYLCKKSIFQLIQQSLGDIPIADGSNLDDLDDYRPGQKALHELDIVSPLLDAGFTKQDIRTGLIAMNEPLWNEPPCACLASRIPYGSTITAEKLHAVYRAETILHQLGFLQVRVRHHGSVARIEVAKEELPKFFDKDVMEKINHQIRQAGFNHVSLDLAGYEQGSLNKDICL